MRHLRQRAAVRTEYTPQAFRLVGFKGTENEASVVAEPADGTGSPQGLDESPQSMRQVHQGGQGDESWLSNRQHL